MGHDLAALLPRPAIFFVLELIAVIASSDREKQAVPAIKDALYVVLVGITLISAVPAAEG